MRRCNGQAFKRRSSQHNKSARRGRIRRALMTRGKPWEGRFAARVNWSEAGAAARHVVDLAAGEAEILKLTVAELRQFTH